MELDTQQARNYLPELYKGLRAIRPNDDQVPTVEMDSHIRALHPDFTGQLFAPFELDSATGMPSLAWLSRALSAREGVLAREPEAKPEDIRLLRQTDPELADRLEARRWLWGHFREHPLLPSTRLDVKKRTDGARQCFVLSLDRVIPGTGWVRIWFTGEGPRGWGDGHWVEGVGGRWVPDPNLVHFLSRNATLPLPVLQQSLEATLKVWVPQVSRGCVGPFWFPGGVMPAVPEPFVGISALHLVHERMGTDVGQSYHRDPLKAAPVDERMPPGHQIFRDRRFAVSSHGVDGVRRWCEARGVRAIVRPLG